MIKILPYWFQNRISCGIHFVIREVRDDVQMSFAAEDEPLPRWKEHLLVAWQVIRTYYEDLMCAQFGHKGEADADVENGGESFYCTRCGYSHSVRW